MTKTLLFTPEEVEANYPAFFTKYPIHAVNTQIGTVFKHHYEHAKNKLRNVFKTDAWGRCKILEVAGHSEDTIRAAMPHTVDVLCNLSENYLDDDYDGRDIDFVLSNRLPDGAKFSRALLKSVGKDNIFVEDALSGHDLCLELPRLPLTGKTDLALVLQNFYSELAEMKKSKYTLYFTVNPYDIINASNTNGKFSSCNTLGGMYETAPMSALSSTTMCMFRLENENSELVGRCWVSVGDDLRSVIVQPSYGFLQGELVQAALVWLTKRIDNVLGNATWKRYYDELPVEVHDFISRDSTAQFYTDHHVYVLIRTDLTAIPIMNLGDVHCLLCGDISGTLLCSSCREEKFSTCANCGKVMSKTPGASMCETCAEELKRCPNCGIYFCNKYDYQCSFCNNISTRCIVCHESRIVNISEDELQLGLFYVCPRCRGTRASVHEHRAMRYAARVLGRTRHFIKEIETAEPFSAQTTYVIAA